MFAKSNIVEVPAGHDPRWQAVVARDRNFDGRFYYSVKTTGVYCRPSCAARVAKPENVSFHVTRADAEQAGFRPCKRCSIEGSFRGRIGWAWNRFLLYGTGGIAFADVTNDYGESFCFGGGCSGLNFDSRTRTLVGWTAGGGIEYAFTPNWLFGVEYRYTDFGRFTIPASSGSTTPEACSAANSTRIII